jgi:hypothetical protein
MHVTSFDLKRVLAFIEPYVYANLLARQWDSSETGYPYAIHQAEATHLGIELQRRFGFQPEPKWGVCKVCYTHATSVLKIPIHETYAPIIEMEIDDINTRWPSPLHKQYFPYTFSMGDGVTVQERCLVMSASDYLVNATEIALLAAELGLWDFHDENVGWSLDHSTFKFFDVQRPQHLALIGNIQSTARRQRTPA